VKRKLIIAAVVFALLACASLAKAEETPIFDVYGGYDYVRYNANPKINGLPPSESFNANGISGQVEYNPIKRLGFVADFSGYALARHGLNTTYQVSYLFGPRLNLGSGRIAPFTQVLVGPVWAEDGIKFGSVIATGLTAGGRIDIRMSRHIAIRPAQAEYFWTRFYDGNHDRRNNFRFGAGVVLRFGEK
jgi:opacity protein-like surface antigen